MVMPVIKKLQSKVNLSAKKEEDTATKRPVRTSSINNEAGTKKEASRPKKYCAFCKSKSEPRYWDASALRRYLNDRGRIVLRSRSGACAKHQRHISREIKRARHLALLPFTVRV